MKTNKFFNKIRDHASCIMHRASILHPASSIHHASCIMHRASILLLMLVTMSVGEVWGGVTVFSSVSQNTKDGNWTIVGSSGSASSQSKVIFPDPAAEPGFPVGEITSSTNYYNKLGSTSNIGAKLAADKCVKIKGLSAGDVIQIYWFGTSTNSAYKWDLSYATSASGGALLGQEISINYPTAKIVTSTTFPALTSSDINNIVNGYAESEGWAYISAPSGAFVYAIKITSSTTPYTGSIYPIGAAFTWGWTQKDAVAMSSDNNGTYTWTGWMNSHQEFKFLCQQDNSSSQWTPAYMAESDNQYVTASMATNLHYETGDTDHKFKIATAGFYDITLDLTDKDNGKMTITPAALREVYLNLSGYPSWANESAKFRVWDDDAKGSVNMTAYTECGATNLYVAEVPTNSETLYFQRYKSDYSTKWNEASANTFNTNNMMSISGWDAGDAGVYAAPTFSVTYHKNDGNSTTDVVNGLVCGSEHTVKAANTFTRDGWSFLTWKQGVTGTVRNPGSTYTVTGSIDLYAQWEKWSVYGDFGNGWTDYPLVNGSVTIPVTAGSNRTFMIKYQKTDASDVYYKNNGTMTSQYHENWTFSSSENTDCHITPTETGSYTFTFNASNKQLTVTYPTPGLSPVVCGNAGHIYAYNDANRIVDGVRKNPLGNAIVTSDAETSISGNLPNISVPGVTAVTLTSCYSEYKSAFSHLASYIKAWKSSSSIKITLAAGYTGTLTIKFGAYSSNKSTTVTNAANRATATSDQRSAETEDNFTSKTIALVAGDNVLTFSNNNAYISHMDIATVAPTTYTVTYAAGEGSGTMTDSNSPYNSGAQVTVLENAFTAPTDKVFAGYKNQDNEDVTAGSQFTISKNVTLTAQWTCATPAKPSVTGTQTYSAGANIQLTAADGYTSYQWYKGGTEDGNIIAGKTNKVLTINSCSLSDAGTYYCKVTNSCGSSIFSDDKAVTVNAIVPTITFSNGEYTVGGAALDLSTLFTSNSNGAVTYSVTAAGETGATVDGTSFTATAAGSATVQASQAADGNYSAKTETATITVTAAPAPGDCMTYFYFANPTDATKYSKTNTDKITIGTFAAGGNTQVAGSITIDGTVYGAATGDNRIKRTSTASGTFTFTIPHGQTGVFYLLACSSGGSARTLLIKKDDGEPSNFATINGQNDQYTAIASETLSEGTYVISESGSNNYAYGLAALKLCPVGSPAVTYTYSVNGSFDSWADHVVTDGSVTINGLAKGTTYDFKVKKTGSDESETWYTDHNQGTMTSSNHTDWPFDVSNPSAANTKITTTLAGNYTFNVNTSGETPVVSVVYPTPCTVTYGENLSVVPSVTSGEEIAAGTELVFTAAERAGYNFNGFYSDSELQTEITGAGVDVEHRTYTVTLSGNTSVYAKYTPIAYTISYNLDGGTNYDGAPTTYNITTATIALGTPTKDGYFFQGWYSDSEFTGDAVTQIALGSTGNKTLYAKWAEIKWYMYSDHSEGWHLYELTDGAKTLTLTKEQSFNFKLVSSYDGGTTKTYYGAENGVNSFDENNHSNWNLTGTNGGSNIQIHAAAAGNYTFTFSGYPDAPKLSATFPTSYSVTYQSGGADGGTAVAANVHIASGESQVVSANTWTNTGNRFTGWSDGENTIQPGATIENITDNIVLTAQWETVVTSITVTSVGDIHSLTKGEQLQLSVEYTPNDAAYGRSVEWSTSNAGVLTVNNNGLVTAQGVGNGQYVTATTPNGVNYKYYIDVTASCENVWQVHMWNTENATNKRFCMHQVGATNEWRTDQLALPNSAAVEKLKVLYDGFAQTYSREWNTAWVTTVGLQGKSDDKRKYPGQDAVGYFRIFSNSTQDNYYIAFEPIYVFTCGEAGQNWTIYHEFAPTATDHTYQTPIVKVPDYNFSAGQTSNYEYYVGSKREDGRQSPWIEGKSSSDRLNSINGLSTKDKQGTYGKFQIFDNYDNNNWYCQFIPEAYAYELRDDDENILYFATSNSNGHVNIYNGEGEAQLPTKTGYRLIGWNRAKNQTTKNIDLGADYGFWSELDIFYPVWEANSYNIIYKDKDDAEFSGTGWESAQPTKHIYGTATTLVNPTKTGYTFNGWYTDQACETGLVTTLGATAYTDHITLYAKWTANSPEPSGECKAWGYGQTDLPSNTSSVVSSVTIKTNSNLQGSRTLFTNASGSSHKLDGSSHFTEVSVSSGTISSISTSCSSGSNKTTIDYAVVWCSTETWDAEHIISAKTETGNANNQAQQINTSTAPSGAKSVRIYRDYTYNAIKYGSETSNYLYYVEVCTNGSSPAPTTYTITYNKGANGTGDAIANGSKTQGVDFTLSSSTYTRDGYTQTGWSLADGDAKAYELGGTYTTDAALTLYPFWTENVTPGPEPGDDVTLTWNVQGNVSGQLNTSSMTSTNSHIAQAQMNALAFSDGYGFVQDDAAKTNSTSKIPTETTRNNDNYIYATFEVEEGYQFTPSAVNVKVVAVTSPKTFDVELSDANTNSGAVTYTQAKNTDPGTDHAYPFAGKSYTGTVTLKIFAYGATDHYRLGTPITITGTVEEAVAPPTPTYTLTVVNENDGCRVERAGIEAEETVEVAYECEAPEGKHLAGFDAKNDQDDAVKLTNYAFDAETKTLTFDMPAYNVTLTAVWEDNCTTPTIEWNQAPTAAVVYGAADEVVSVITNQESPIITWKSSNEDVATVSNGTIHYVGVGTTTISASYTGSGEYCSQKVTVEQLITVTAAEPTVTFNNGQYLLITGNELDLDELFESNSDGDVTYTITNRGTTDAAIAGNIFTAATVGVGNTSSIVKVQASQAAAGNYQAKVVSATIVVEEVCGEVYSVTLTGEGKPSANATGYLAGSAAISAQNGKPASGYKFGSAGHYLSMTMTENFKANDLIAVTYASPASSSGSKYTIYKDWNTSSKNGTAVEPVLSGENYVILPAGEYGTTLTIGRTSSNSWNAYVQSAYVLRPCLGTYYIVYNTNGKGANPRPVTASAVPDELPTPHVPGYDFGGWYTTAECNGEPVVAGTAIEANTFLYAKWIEKDNVTCTTVYDYQDRYIDGGYKNPEKGVLSGDDNIALTTPWTIYEGTEANGINAVTAIACQYDNKGTDNKISSYIKIPKGGTSQIQINMRQEGVLHAYISGYGAATEVSLTDAKERVIEQTTSGYATGTGVNEIGEVSFNLEPGINILTVTGGNNGYLTNLRICIDEPEVCEPPVIIEQPQSILGHKLGQPEVTLSVVTEEDANYQWYTCGSNGSNMVPVAGGTEATLTVIPQIVGTTFYRCVLTSPYCSAKIESRIATVEVVPTEATIRYQLFAANEVVQDKASYTVAKEINDNGTNAITANDDWDLRQVDFLAGKNKGYVVDDVRFAPAIQMPTTKSTYVEIPFAIARDYTLRLTAVDFQVMQTTSSKAANYQLVISDGTTTITSNTMSVTGAEVTSITFPDQAFDTPLRGTATARLYAWSGDDEVTDQAYRLKQFVSITGEISTIARPTLTWTTTPQNGAKGGNMTIAATSNNMSGTITYSTSDTEIATVNETTGVLNYVGAGEVTIYAHVTGDGVNYHSEGNTISETIIVSQTVKRFTNAHGDGLWSTGTNWTPQYAPTMYDKVIIDANCTVNSNMAAAAEVVINGAYTLTIAPTAALTVTGKIYLQPAEGEPTPVTSPDRIFIHSDENGTGALIFDNSEANTMATVDLYSKAYSVKVPETGKTRKYWQYIGIPVQSIMALDGFSNAMTYKYEEANGWIKKTSYEDLENFWGIGLTFNGKPGHIYTLPGTLASTAEKEITLTAGGAGAGMHLIGNSWTAPIQIDRFSDSDFGDAEKTVYIYNTGRDDEAEENQQYGSKAGQWTTIPLNLVKSNSPVWAGPKVIPAMQAFEVNTTVATTLTLNYDRLVRGQRTEDINTPLYTPSRVAEQDAISMMRIRVAEQETMTNTDVYLVEGEGFSTGYDNGWDGRYSECDDRSAGFYSLSEEGNMAVNALPELEGTQLGFVPNKSRVYTISFGYDGQEAYYLNDLQTLQSTLIQEGNTYMFVSGDGDMVERFMISKTPFRSPSVTTGVDGAEAEVGVQKVIIEDKLFIIRDGHMYNATGAMVK